MEKKRLDALELIAAINIELARAPADVEALLTLATSRLSRLLPGTWMAIVMNPDPKTSRIVVAADRDREMAQYVNDYLKTIDGPDRVLTMGLSQQVIESGCPVAKKTTFSNFLTMVSPATQAYLSMTPPPCDLRSVDFVIVPMRIGPATLGTLGMLDSRRRGVIDELDLDWLQVVADRVAVSVDHARLVEQTTIHAGEIDLIRTIAMAHRHSGDRQLTFRAIVERILVLSGIDAADIMLLSDDGSELIMVASAGYRTAPRPDLRIDSRSAPLEHEARSTEIHPCAPLEDTGYNPRRSLLAREGFQRMIRIPIHNRTRMVGILNLYSRSPVAWDMNHMEFFDAVGGLVAMAVDQAAAARREPATQDAALGELELEIVRLIAVGWTNREIAAQIHRSENTVKYHVRRILEKADAANRADLVRRALHDGWISPQATG